MTVVPLVEPPVGTRGRPLAFFLFLSKLGSSHVPKAGGVVENARTFWDCREAARVAVGDGIGARVCRSGLGAAQILRLRKAFKKADPLEAAIAVSASELPAL